MKIYTELSQPHFCKAQGKISGFTSPPSCASKINPHHSLQLPQASKLISTFTNWTPAVRIQAPGSDVEAMRAVVAHNRAPLAFGSCLWLQGACIAITYQSQFSRMSGDQCFPDDTPGKKRDTKVCFSAEQTLTSVLANSSNATKLGTSASVARWRNRS